MKFIIDTNDLEISKSIIEMLLENEFLAPISVKEIEEINEEELDKFANDDVDVYELCFAEYPLHCQVHRKEGFYDGFKAGYQKAKELLK